MRAASRESLEESYEALSALVYEVAIRAGFWHGIIAPIAFIVSLFQPGVRMYEIRNTGWHYDLGFLLGIVAVLGGSGSQTVVCY